MLAGITQVNAIKVFQLSEHLYGTKPIFDWYVKNTAALTQQQYWTFSQNFVLLYERCIENGQ